MGKPRQGKGSKEGGFETIQWAKKILWVHFFKKPYTLHTPEPFQRINFWLPGSSRFFMFTRRFARLTC